MTADNVVRPITDLPPDGVKRLLIRRTGNDTVKVSVGCRWPGEDGFRGWFGARPPTHFCKLPPMPYWMKKERTNGK